MTMNYKVIDNFLDEKYFDSLVTLFTDKEKTGNNLMPWFFISSIVNADLSLRFPNPKNHEKWVEKDKLFYMTHLLYENSMSTSCYFDKLTPLLEKLEARCLVRIKANLYPNTEILHEHPMHVDYDFFTSGAVLSLNTCDGYTKLEDGTKVDSVANRVLLFDASKKHCSTTTTNVSARINININYIREKELQGNFYFPT